jgi:putative ABC transport system permease protein
MGWENEFIKANAAFDTGHVKITTRAYQEEADQIPNDLAYIGLDSLLSDLNSEYTDMFFQPRIRFGGLVDIPDENGETRAQGPAVGLAVDLFSADTPEPGILNIAKAMRRGKLPEKQGEVLLSDEFAEKLDIEIGGTATLISSTMYGGIAAQNYTIVGTLTFGIAMLDRGAIIADISDIQYALDMEDAAGEILGFFHDPIYNETRAQEIETSFNVTRTDTTDEFSPVMGAIHNQAALMEMMGMASQMGSIIIFVFMVIMSLVLWNAGLRSSLRRYGEIGVRLAIGENKRSLYISIMMEALVLGIIGSILGTAVGLGVSYIIQVKGLDFTSMMQNSTMLTTGVYRTRITSTAFYIGFIPGILATLLGSAISGIGIYKRQTAQLFKELEV